MGRGPISTVLVLLAARQGDPVMPDVHHLPAEPDLVIAADSGVGLARRLGVAVDIVIGDLDSADPSDVDAARAEGAVVEQFPRDKDHTDLALALTAASSHDPERITVVGGAGGRLDHGAANLLALADPGLAPACITAWFGGARITVVRGGTSVELSRADGGLVSLIPVGAIKDISTTGLRWDLDRDELPVTSTRGVSNQITEATATIKVGRGVLLAIQPADEEESP